MLERAIGIACLQRGRQVALFAMILRLAAVTSPFVTAIVVLASTSVVATVVRMTCLCRFWVTWGPRAFETPS
jgi:hypothetical protein